MPPRYEQGCHNLRLYLHQAILPEMNCTRFCPHLNNPEVYNATTNLFQLSPTPESTRKLRQILHLIPEVINKRINAFMLQIPCKPILGMHDSAYDRPAALLIPAESFEITFHAPNGIYDIPTMTCWMKQPLLTVERVVSLVWPEETEDYRMVGGPDYADRDAELYKPFFYRKCRGVDRSPLQESVCKVLIAQLIPWALTPQNMEDFVRVTELPAFSVDHDTNVNDPPKYNRSHKIWGKLWDDCSRKKCPYFALTVYDSWIFGVFVKGWTTVVISDIIRYSDSNPTILQWLVFWIASSMKFSGSWETPLLSRFGNPDIRHLSKVALRDSSDDMERNTIELQEEWLDKHHKEILDSENQTTQELPGVENTWLTSFSGQ